METVPNIAPERRKPGPIARPGTRVTTVVLDGDAVDWAKEQPGGVSEILRRLLRSEMERANAAGDEKTAQGDHQ